MDAAALGLPNATVVVEGIASPVVEPGQIIGTKRKRDEFEKEEKPSPSKKRARLTPEEREKRDQEKAAKRAAKEEAKRKKEEERKKREDERKAKQEAKEAERKRKEEQRALKEAERKRKEEELQLTKQKREEEKRLKEEARQKKEAERKAREEAEAAERAKKDLAKQRQAEMFKMALFGSPSKALSNASFSTDTSAATKSTPVTPAKTGIKFTIRWEPGPNTIVASLPHRSCDTVAFDAQLSSDIISPDTVVYSFRNFTRECAMRRREQRRLAKASKVCPHWVASLPSEVQARLRPKIKLLKFHDNYRPAYFGTFSAKSRTVKPRKPLGRDSTLDYEYDSDDDWEDVEDGESLSDCEDDEDEEEELDDREGAEEEEDGFIVPHGYLSPDEGMEGEDDRDDDEDNMLGSDDAAAAAKPQPTAGEERKQRKVTKPEIQLPRVVGVAFAATADEVRPELKPFCVQMLFDRPINVDIIKKMLATKKPKPSATTDGSDGGAAKPSVHKSRSVPESLLPELVKHVHLQEKPLWQLVDLFHEAHPEVSKRQVEKKIGEIATKQKLHEDSKARWRVNPEVLQSYPIASEPLPPAPKAASPKMEGKGGITRFFHGSPQKTASVTVPTVSCTEPNS